MEGTRSSMKASLMLTYRHYVISSINSGEFRFSPEKNQRRYSEIKHGPEGSQKKETKYTRRQVAHRKSLECNQYHSQFTGKSAKSVPSLWKTASMPDPNTLLSPEGRRANFILRSATMGTESQEMNRGCRIFVV